MKKTNSRVQCLACGVILESFHRHDYKLCGCPNRTMVDGGSAYLRCGGVNLSLIKVIESSEQESDSGGV